MLQGNVSKCTHSKATTTPLNPSLYICLLCSSLIIYSSDDKNQNDGTPPQKTLSVKTIKPESYEKPMEIFPSFIPLPLSENSNSTFYFSQDKKNFINKREFLKYRMNFIKSLKKKKKELNLTWKTYYLAVDYFDRICTNITGFNKENKETIEQIQIFCIILASKTFENFDKNFEIKQKLDNKISKKNFFMDEMYILSLLDFKINPITAYDYLKDILNSGFIFQNESANINSKKMNLIYSTAEQILFTFSENNLYLDLTPKQMAIGIVAFSRKLLNLEPFSPLFKEVFIYEDYINDFIINDNIENSVLNTDTDIERKIKIIDEFYFFGFSRINRCIKIQISDTPSTSSPPSRENHPLLQKNPSPLKVEGGHNPPEKNVSPPSLNSHPLLPVSLPPQQCDSLLGW